MAVEQTCSRWTLEALAKRMLLLLTIALAVALPGRSHAQATSRHCDTTGANADKPGPACLLAHQNIGPLTGPVYWSLYNYPTLADAQADRTDQSTVVASFGAIWLFTVGSTAQRPAHGKFIADVGPIPVEANTPYVAEFLKSTFSSGMTAPIHVHSGPEAFYAVSGDTCLETPDGVQTGRGPGNSLVIRRGPPMLLMAIGPTPRQGFALILHDDALPPTTLVQHWTPKGLCADAAAGR